MGKGRRDPLVFQTSLHQSLKTFAHEDEFFPSSPVDWGTLHPVDYKPSKVSLSEDDDDLMLQGHLPRIFPCTQTNNLHSAASPALTRTVRCANHVPINNTLLTHRLSVGFVIPDALPICRVPRGVYFPATQSTRFVRS